ncbi:hypothetical protein F0562_034156 [Nyssa sinensis]|uniref:Uncharacterized protein n=1 Tax=Nyssa sinensis TaxID=561372 RepID=A0A5J5AHN9_9ASTE|nr:hypothetical protein F0562_034156 [Nyssa sinensis]
MLSTLSTTAATTQPASSTKDTEQQNNSYEIQPIKPMEIGATSNDTFLDNSASTSATPCQPESSTKFTEQQKTSYAIQPIKSMEIGTTSSDPLLDCSDILQRDSYQNPTGQNTQATPLHTNSSTIAVASQANSTCHLTAAPFLMQADALDTNTANRPAIRSSASAAGVHSVEGSIGDGVPITYPASAVCTKETSSNSNGLEPTIHSTPGIRDIAFSDAVCHVANQIGGSPQIIKTLEIGATSNATFLENSVSTSANASQPDSPTKFTEQQKSPYAIQPIKLIEIGTTSSDPLLDCPDILQRDAHQNPTGQVMAMISN